MIIGFNLLYLLPGIVGGTETYAIGLLHGFARLDLPARFLVYLNREAADWPLPPDPRFQRVVCPVNATSRLARYWYEQLRLPGRVSTDRADLLHSLGYVAPLRLARPSVVTVHDVHHLAHGRPGDWARRRLLGGFVRRSVRGASAVITDSDFARGQISRAYHVPAAAIHVVPLAPNPRLENGGPPGNVPATAPISAPFLVAFGGMTPNKNLPRLLEAFELARARFGLAQQLVIVGRVPESLRLAGSGVVATGYLDESQLSATLTAADALVFPSTYEGFGLPVLEAMAKGVPVACSDAAAMPEVGGDAVVYFDPLNVEDMARQIALVGSDGSLRNTLAARGRQRALQFTWERAARETLAIYRRVLA